MTRYYLALFISITVISSIALLSCNDDQAMDVTVEELLIGTWVTDEVDVTTMIDGQTVADYLVNDVGLSASEAAALDALLTSYLTSELDVTLVMKADYTYESMFSRGMDNGTWSLSADEKSLTLVEGGEATTYTIESISSKSMTVSISAGIEYDVDNDSNTPDVTVDASATFTMLKQP